MNSNVQSFLRALCCVASVVGLLNRQAYPLYDCSGSKGDPDSWNEGHVLQINSGFLDVMKNIWQNSADE